MIKDIRIVKASAESTIGGKLNIMALSSMASVIVGSNDSTIKENTLMKMWRTRNNRFSHEFAYEAKQGVNTLGILTCYPSQTMNKLAFPTLWEIIKIRGLSLVPYALKNLRSVFRILTLKEVENGEFHVGSIAMLPESRGMGIGKQLLSKAEELAMKQSHSKISLTVREDNDKARQLYEKIGYKVVNKLNGGHVNLYRMVKDL
ncbi:GNAT family N-acetyltransferase [Bacillus sp. A116_S68]|nr:GNAT family N-acetyltransferase [Bacillus sp. A116_S68]